MLYEVITHPSLPPHLDGAFVEDLPETPGVYLFYGQPGESGEGGEGNELPLYVGKAKNLRNRVLSHFSGDHRNAKEMALSQQVHRVDWIETSGEIGALLKEATLIRNNFV